jgi:GT2 family glycosyltransferase
MREGIPFRVDLSICILTRNQPELLPKCVAACFAEIARAGIIGEVIVIDNASIDGSPRKVADQFPAVRMIRSEENLGFSAANNKAIRISQGRYLLVLNDDAILQEGSLELMLRKLESDAKVAAIGSKLLNPDGSAQIGFANKRFPRIRSVFCQLLPFNQFLYNHALTRDLLTDWRDAETSGETDYVAGACLLVRRSALEAVGLFDEGFFFWYEDTDLCYRLKEAGWVVFYLAEAKVTHYGSSSFRQWSQSETNVVLFRSMMYFFQKHSSLGKQVLLRMTVAVALLFRTSAVLFFRIIRGRLKVKELADLMKPSFQAIRLVLWEWHL